MAAEQDAFVAASTFLHIIIHHNQDPMYAHLARDLQYTGLARLEATIAFHANLVDIYDEADRCLSDMTKTFALLFQEQSDERKGNYFALVDLLQSAKKCKQVHHALKTWAEHDRDTAK